MASPNVQAIRKVLHNPPMLPRYYYTGLGEIARLSVSESY